MAAPRLKFGLHACGAMTERDVTRQEVRDIVAAPIRTYQSLGKRVYVGEKLSVVVDMRNFCVVTVLLRTTDGERWTDEDVRKR